MPLAIPIAVAAMVASTAYQVKSGMDASSERKDALGRQKVAEQKALAETKSQQETAQSNINRANQRQPDISSILSSVTAEEQGGLGGTMLTGAQGVDPASLSIGKNTLLGG